LHTWLETHPPAPAHAIDCPGMQSIVLASIGAAQLHVPKPMPSLLQTWWLEHPLGPVQGTEAPGTQSRELASTGEAQSQGPKPLPFVLQTWLLEHPPGPAHATEVPGMHAVATEASVDAFVPLASGGLAGDAAPATDDEWGSGEYDDAGHGTADASHRVTVAPGRTAPRHSRRSSVPFTVTLRARECTWFRAPRRWRRTSAYPCRSGRRGPRLPGSCSEPRGARSRALD